jgi:CRP-like cAMP-binding protein
MVKGRDCGIRTGIAPPAEDIDARTLLRKLIQFPRVKYASGRALFRQGDPADAFFYVASGSLYRTITTEKGNERLVAIVGEKDFCGEECLAGRRYRRTSAIVVEEAEIVRIDKGLMPVLMHDWADFADAFTASLLSHFFETEAALIEHLVGSVELRLRRVLLKLAHVGKNDRQVGVISNVKQEMLAGLVGTTRPRVNYFLNRFRRLGLIEYGGTSDRGTIRVHAALGQTREKAWDGSHA